MIIVPFIPVHLIDLEVHKYMGFMNGSLNNEYGEYLANFPAYTAIDNGDVIGCAGIIQSGIYRWQAWALLTPQSGKNMLGITRAINRFFDDTKPKRLETQVRRDFKAGHKWVNMLGFRNETPDGMKAWGDDGMDYDLYARINNG